MKQRIALILFCGALAYIFSNYSAGAAAQNGTDGTGASGSPGCSCHGSANINTTVELDSAGVRVNSYHAGMAYTVKISAANNTTNTGATNLSHFGFQVAAVLASGAGTGSAAQAGTWGASLPANVQNTTAASGWGGNFDIIEQSTQIPATTGTGGNGTTYVESIPWTAPAAGTGTVDLYGVVNAVNNNSRSSGDFYYVAPSVSITEAVAVAQVAAVHIALTNGTNPTCASSNVTFSATPTNGGNSPSYQWKVNGANVGTNSATYTTTGLTNGAVVTCVMTSNLSGVTGSPATSNAITMTINPTVTPSVSIATPNHTICAGSSVTFTATPTNGGTPSYQWKVNGTNVGTNSATYTTTTLTNGAVVTCVMTSTASCASPTTATSNSINMTVNPSVIPAVSIATPNTTICSGTSVTFTATPTNGGTPSYQWKVNGANAGTNSATYTTTTLTNGATVTCVMTSTAGCASPTTATSNAITITVSGSVTPSVSISTPSTSFCAGSSVTFTATPTNGGNTPSYQWKVNGVNAGTNSPTFTTTTLTNGAVVTCVLTSGSSCASPTTATSNAITMSAGTVTPAISISAAQGAICNAASDTFTAVAVNGGNTPAYQWQVNGSNAGSNSPTFISSTLTNGAAVTCKLTSSLSCASPATATSNTVTVTVNPAVTPTLAITAAHTTICQGVPDSFLATGTNLGNNPSYQWLVNGMNSGFNSPAYITSLLANGNSVSCKVTSNAACASPTTATSNAIAMTVTPSPNITVNPSGPLTVCAGDSLLLSANGGTAYNWTTGQTTASIWVHQGGTYNVTGSNGNCSAIAATPATVTVDNPPVPTVTQSGNIITSTAAANYQWLFNGSVLSGDTAQQFTISKTGSYMVITRDANGCYSKSITYTFTYVNGINGISGNLGVRLYPVPNQGRFMVEADNIAGATLVIYNVYGQKLYEQILEQNQTTVSANQLAAGVYFVTVLQNGNTQTIRMQVTRE